MKFSEIKKYLLEGLVIFSSVFLSFYLEEIRIEDRNESDKNELVLDLVKTLEQDIDQIKSLLKILYTSEELISEIQNDIDQGHSLYSNIDVINKLIDIEVGISFFPKDGIYNQLIATGSFELIGNNDLKIKLLEMYNHQRDRNFATSLEIDTFNVRFRNDLLDEFRIRFNYNSYDGEFYGTRSLDKFKFNTTYYFSNEFYGLISQAKLYLNMYTRQLKDIQKEYESALELSRQEVTL